jgi:RNA methyltransferase, TrmH family
MLAARPDEVALAYRCADTSGSRVIDVRHDVLTRALDTVTPQPIAATVARLDVPLGRVTSPRFAVVLAGVNDPGNAGTLIRSAAAAGADLVVLTRQSVDLYNPKTVRASAGAIFHVPLVVEVGADELLENFGRLGLRRWGTAADVAECVEYTAADLSAPCAIVLGNESHGIPEAVSPGLDGLLTIPMTGAVESLNVAVAGSLILFEAARQKRAAGRGRA